MKKNPIPNYEGLYEITRSGKVFNCITGERLYGTEVINKKKPKKYGAALAVSLYKNKKFKRYLIHRLVGLVFILNPENKPQINHKDGNRKNNWDWNLEWNTNSENVWHAYNVLKRTPPNTGKFGSKSSFHKAIGKYDKEGNLLQTWESIIECSRETKFHHKSLSKNLRGKRITLGGFIFKYLKQANA